uniref:Uncharacterized protein n=1 Tax=Rhizophora mucronata TaxID=61149 RepID=A0A2P2NI47_RHIMU
MSFFPNTMGLLILQVCRKDVS